MAVAIKCKDARCSKQWKTGTRAFASEIFQVSDKSEAIREVFSHWVPAELMGLHFRVCSDAYATAAWFAMFTIAPAQHIQFTCLGEEVHHISSYPAGFGYLFQKKGGFSYISNRTESVLLVEC